MELLNNKLSTFQGDRDKIVSVVYKYHKELDFISNTYINYIPCFKSLNPNKPILIISLIHKKTFLVKAWLIKKIGVSCILWWIFGFNPQIERKIHQSYSVSLYGEYLDTKFPITRINTIDDLLKYAITTRSLKEWPSRKSTSWITLEYLHKNGNFDNLSSSIGSGIAKTKAIAIAKSVSEVLERFSAWVISKSIANIEPCHEIVKLMMWSYELKKSDKLFPIAHIINKKITTIPGNLLFFPYDHNLVWDASSNGMSCHITKAKALENALFELIERDAFALSWLLRSGISHLQKNRKIKNLIKKYKLDKYNVELFVMHFDNPIPVVLSITKEGKKISTSMGIWYNLDQAIEKSLSESGQFSEQNMQTESELQPEDNDIQTHIKHYLNEDNYYKVAWFYDLPSVSVIQAKDLFQSIKNDKELIVYYDYIWTNLYSFQYKNPLLSYHKRYCMRVISDNLLHIWFWENVPSSILNSDRLKLRKDKLNVQSLNTEIHPFG